MYTSQPCARRAHRNHLTYIHPPIVGLVYPISTYIFNCHMLPKLLAAYIQYNDIFLLMYTSQPCVFGRSGFHFLDVRGLDVGGPFLDVRGFLTFRGLFLDVRGFRTLGVRGSGLDPERPNPQRPKTPNVQKA